MYILGANIYH